MTGKDALLQVLDEYQVKNGWPYYLQGSLSDEDAYHPAFFTFMNTETEDARFFDNEETATIWNLELFFYSDDPALVNGIFKTMKPDLKAAGFIVNGQGFDVLSDEPSHTGRGIDITYIERGQKE